jgi:PAS domain S-box-containing protein
MNRQENVDKGFKKTIMVSKICRPVAYMFIILFILVWFNEILDLPHHIFGTVKTPINWGQAIIESIMIVTIGIITVLCLIHNINKRKEAERVIGEEKEKAKKYLDVAGVILVVINKDQKVNLVNKKGCEILGWEEKEIIGKNWVDYFIRENMKDKVKNVFNKLMAGEKVQFEYFENPIVTKRGEERIVAWHNTILTDESGNITGVLSSGEDITERKAMEKALQERTQDLSNRVKELNCLYAISRFMEKKDISLERILQGTVNLIPSAWQKPKTLCAQIILEGNVFKTKNFKRSTCKQSSSIFVHDKKCGTLEIYHPEGKGEPTIRHSPKEEKNLLKIIAERLGKIIEHKQAEETLCESEEQYRTTIDSMRDAIHVVNSDLQLILFNKAIKQWNRKLGLPTDMIGKSIFEVFPFLSDRVRDEYEKVLDAGKILITEEKTKIGDREFVTESRKIPVFEGNRITKIITIIKDITDRKKAEGKIKQSLREKEALLREIHHRVKNNLQIISSLLKLQAGRVNDDYVKKVYQESNNRITAMALVHEILYQSEDLAEIDLNQYIIHIAKNILKVFGTYSKHIDFKTEGDMINLGINQAVPIGLVLNEIISNSLKHAFPDAQKGEIKIRSHLLENNEIELVVSDNGRGLPDYVDHRNTKTLGLKLITGLIEEQIKGTLVLSRNSGTQYAIRFKRKD